MEKANKYLFLTLKEDLIELNKVNEEIKLKTRSSVDSTWLCDKSNDSNCKFSLNNVYLSCLEHIIDRLYVILNNINNYLDVDSLNSVKPATKNITKPTNFTLGRVVNLFWKKLVLSQESRLAKLKCNNDNSLLSIGIQTEICSLAVCDSCYIAKDCIKTVAHEVENIIFKSTVSKIKKQIQNNIFDITQFACMKYLADAIKDDVKKIVEANTDLEFKQLKDAHEIDDMKHKIEESKSITTNLKMKYAELQNNYTIKCNESANAKETIISLNYRQAQHENDWQKQIEINQNLQESTENLKLVVTNLKNENQNLSEHIAVLHIKFAEVSKERDEWKTNYNDARSKNETIKNNYSDLMIIIAKIEREVFQRKFIELDEDLIKCYEDIVKKQNQFEVELQELKLMLKSITNMQEDRMKKLCGLIYNRNLIDDLEVQGDPVTDMTNQLELNQRNIDILQTQNEKLRKVLRRLKDNSYIADI